ncbi:MAG: hypothetical protein A3J48_01895 [Candidatus Doudnabacteria bacterium RIFCSPHIGHO2_02_FULL_46_11]|uniref:NYN domain-containing protein n=1 Tax=Candidatus Doudnabacteria bacterium RIFCSPHIGHO2_02_FULL_46_11 TaxID=1817832 RepID=A0A1F5PAD3_9BACT|nr:MAG: hypothetical protein A3J48_01895 [Candidatus Doudnabacteria bacterium RIFCSPHIGHO2_02_FULL_46_11]
MALNPLARSKTAKYEDQRIGVFVDVQNLYYSAYNIYHSRVNYGAILESIIQKRKLVRSIAYVIQADQPEEQSFFDALGKQGYEIRAKPLQTFIGGAKKGDWDVGITLDIVSMLEKLDVVVLVSGDGDFDDVLHYIKSNGARAEVVAFGKSTAGRIKELADDFIDLDVDYKKYTLPMPKRKQDNGKDDKGIKIFS